MASEGNTYDVVDRRTHDWELGLGCVLYDPRLDTGRKLWHVTKRLTDHDGDDHLYELSDGTHTERQFFHHEDVIRMFVPAGWCWPVGEKPLYHLTRECGADDPADLMTDGGIDVPTCDTVGCSTECISLEDGWEQIDGTLRCADCWEEWEQTGSWPDEEGDA
ncbi:hypothetical protein NDI56_03790 [Haloarcula sp. S1CR25-12]|uniref:Uncharacterized protein n=1 Tax=Haloarcula saliterrae TaxID=2950534 RepID=A0ABU2F8K8_9EURY|nr:hypothetical protein [Haloarcula sp. S1CR25-12]MDS0258532.1 hypothetical protein [Haloarcula sp. S1CR25-12]